MGNMDSAGVLIETSWNVKSGRKDTIETAVAY